MKPSKPFSETSNKILSDPEVAALYLEECLADGDIELFKAALRHVAEARGGMSSLSKATKLNRESLYRALSKRGNPSIDTLNKVLGALGLRIGVVPADQAGKH